MANASSFTNLFPALVNCFVIIIFGYLAGWFNIVTQSQGKGISNFVGTFALPAIIFKSMVELNFTTVNWSFMLAAMCGKALVFAIIIAITLAVQRRKGLGQAALFAIFSTQSNDFALGYPIIKVLYAKSNPELLQYIYLVAPISLLILNPIGFIMLEIDKQSRRSSSVNKHLSGDSKSRSSSCDTCPALAFCSSASTSELSKAEKENQGWRLALKICRGVFLNPIVFMVFFGLAFHFILRGKLPSLLKQILTTLTNSFSATALFYLGLSMVGKLSKQKGVGLLVPLTLIVAKILLLPILIRMFMYTFSNVIPFTPPMTNVTSNASYTSTLANFGFLYGTFPTAPSVIIYATRYGMEVDRLASGMVLCTTLSAPIMYVSAWTLTISSMQYEFYKNQVVLVDRDVSIVGIMCSLWCIAVFIGTKKFRRVPHVITIFLTSSMFFTSVMSVVAISGGNYSQTWKIVAYSSLFFGVHATRFMTASLAIALIVLKVYGEAKVWYLRWCFIFFPGLLSLITTIVIVTTTGKFPIITTNNPVVVLGFSQKIISCIVIAVCLATVIVCLIILFRVPDLFEPPGRKLSTSSKSGSFTSDSETNGLLPRRSCDSESLSNELSPSIPLKWWEFRSGKNQLTRHIVLLSLLAISLFVGLTITAWRVSDHNMLSGNYFEVSFLDSVFNFGQSFFVFLIFGIDTELIIEPFMKAWRSIFLRDDTVSLAPLSEVEKEVLRKCFVFTRHHLKHCKPDIVATRRKGLQTYEDAFRGSDLCTWLVEVGLVQTRREAILYGNQLMLGRVLHHVTNSHYFQDKEYLYQFENLPEIRKSKRRKKSISSTSAQGSSTQLNTPDCELGECKLENLGFTFELYLNDADLNTWTVGSPARFGRGKTLKHRPRGQSNDLNQNNNQDSTSDEVMLNLAQDLLQFDKPGTSRHVVRALVQPAPKNSDDLNDW